MPEEKRSAVRSKPLSKSSAGAGRVLILQELFSGYERFSELHRALAGVSHRTLTQQLRELEGHGIVKRKIHRQVPPKVEYSLTPVGETLRPVIAVMHDWAEKYSEARLKNRKRTLSANFRGTSSHTFSGEFARHLLPPRTNAFPPHRIQARTLYMALSSARCGRRNRSSICFGTA